MTIFWYCQKQKVISQLTIRVEYRDVVNDGIKVVWIQNLMDELEFHFKELVVVY
jgi:hypothetical protein